MTMDKRVFVLKAIILGIGLIISIKVIPLISLPLMTVFK
jgi:hypothetical protein